MKENSALKMGKDATKKKQSIFQLDSVSKKYK